MRASEILRQMADMIDAKSQATTQTQSQEQSTGSPDLIPVPTDTFLPPLQGKYELLKKAVGVDNTFDENVGKVAEDPEASNHKVTPMSPDETDALERMKKAAGVNALIINDLSDDEPLEN
jgi:hypothetical protein